MLSEAEVLRAREIHSTLYEATKNPFYYAMIQAYNLVLGDKLPASLDNEHLDQLMADFENSKHRNNRR